MADFGKFKVGNAIYPLTSSLSNSLLKDVNAPLYYALDYFVSMIQTHLGARWNAAVVAAGMPELDGYVIKYALPYDPTPELLSQQVQFPLFALWEKSGREEPKTLSYYHTVGTWKAIYALPALTSGQKELLHPFLRAVKTVLADRTIQGHDPAYQNNLVVWDVNVSGIEKIRLTEFEFGNFPFDPSANIFLPTVMMTFDVLVRQDSDPTFFETLAGVDTSLELEGVTLVQTQLNFP